MNKYTRIDHILYFTQKANLLTI